MMVGNGAGPSWSTAWPVVFMLFLPACSVGGLGEPCKVTDAPPLGAFNCDTGLVCNTQVPSTICEKPNTHDVGGPCSDDDNCRIGLRCERLACAPLAGLGDPCSDTCASGLACVKSASGAFCEVADAGLPATD
jgi:hypothetical protein